MKKILAAFLVLATSVSAMAQSISNGNLETWATSGGVEAPAGWTTLDQLTGLPIGSVTKSTNKHAGTYAAKLSVVTLPGAGSFPGIMSLGSSQSSSQIVGVPYTHRPDKFQFYYQYNLNSPDTTFAFASLTRWDAANQISEVVGFAEVIIDAATNNYTLADAQFMYTSNLQPDSLMIVFFASTASVPAAGTTLYIDDVQLVGNAITTGVKDEVAAAKVRVYPNPSEDGTFYIQSEIFSASTQVEVYNLTGQKVHSQEMNGTLTNAQPLHLQHLPKGVYLLNLSNEKQSASQRIILK